MPEQYAQCPPTKRDESSVSGRAFKNRHTDDGGEATSHRRLHTLQIEPIPDTEAATINDALPGFFWLLVRSHERTVALDVAGTASEQTAGAQELHGARGSIRR